ncbi:hypothetical protein Ancab_019902 [Ancistrocladus abbreviatus]
MILGHLGHGRINIHKLKSDFTWAGPLSSPAARSQIKAATLLYRTASLLLGQALTGDFTCRLSRMVTWVESEVSESVSSVGFYVGTSLWEEVTATPVTCCLSQGSLVKLDARTRVILWQTFMLPDYHGKLGGYTGAAIWGSSPSIDKSRNLVYVVTGNLYSIPSRINKCQEEENNQTIPTHPDRCIQLENHSDSFVALDLDSDEIKWYQQLGGYDVWFFACNNLSSPGCPLALSLMLILEKHQCC